MNFALIGAAGYIAPRHMRAIRETGHQLVAACDPRDAVGVLDQYAPAARFFTNEFGLERYLYARKNAVDRVRWVSVCSPNDEHYAHAAMALSLDASVICEKPLCLTPGALDALTALERQSRGRVCTVLQLRLHSAIVALRERVCQSFERRHRVVVNYIAPRGPWYDVSWKGNEARSGGIVVNIGIHIFDILLWLFGAADQVSVYQRDARRAAGALSLARADVWWYLSTDRRDADRAKRHLTIDGDVVDLSAGFTDLHTRVYEETLAGRGCGIEDARPSIELVQRIQHAPVLCGLPSHPTAARLALASPRCERVIVRERA